MANTGTEDTIQEENTSLEDYYSEQLEYEQAIYNAQNSYQELIEEGEAYGHPSYIKYGFLLFLAIIIDIVDLSDLTGIGAIIGRSVSLVLTCLMILIFWLTNTKQKRAESYIDRIPEAISEIQANVAHATRMGLRTAKIARRIPGLRGVARQIPRGLVKVRRLARKNPMTKLLLGGTLNLIPFLAVVPWSIVSVVLSYLDEKKSYENARIVALEVSGEVPESTAI